MFSFCRLQSHSVSLLIPGLNTGEGSASDHQPQQQAQHIMSVSSPVSDQIAPCGTSSTAMVTSSRGKIYITIVHIVNLKGDRAEYYF